MYYLRSHYSHDVDIILHANDVKSAFCQVKLHPNVFGAFLYIIADMLFLSCGQPFRTDFGAANWEVIRQILEHSATQLFHEKSLCCKHHRFLGKLQWDGSLRGKPS